MAVTFVIGRAGSGKTRYCLERAAAHLATNSTERLVLLVPEQASFQMERALAQRTVCGGFWRADVLSFSRLARRVAAEQGVGVEPLSKDARRFALRYIIARSEAQLEALRPLCRKPGFLAELAALIEEWLVERITADELRTACAKLPESVRSRRIRDLVMLYEAYGRWIREHAPDPAQRLEALREQLPRIDWLRDAHVFVDGFAGFTGQEFETLAVLARCTRALTITLLIDPENPIIRHPPGAANPLGLFARTAETYSRLIRTFQQAGVEIHPPVALARPCPDGDPATAAFLRRETALAAAWDRSDGRECTAPERAEQPRIVVCESPRYELRHVAREIRRRVILSGGRVRFRDCAVIARDLEPLADLCREVFADYEIPFFLDRRRTLRAHPLVTLIGRVMDAVRDDFAPETMLRMLRTDLLPLRRDESEALQRAIAEFQVSGAAAWAEIWPGLDRPEPPEPYAGGGAEIKAARVSPLLALRRRLVAALSSLSLAAQSGTGTTGSAWAARAYETIESLGVAQRLNAWIADAQRDGEAEKAEIHRLAWSALTEALDELHAILGDTVLSLDDVASLLNGALSDATVGLTPPRLDQVLVSAIDRSRHPEIRHAWLIGFNEGMFPRQPPQPLLLTNSDRLELERAGVSNLGVPEREVFSERLLAYIAMTRPSESLTISYSRRGMDGDDRQPSPFLAEIMQAFGVRAIETAPAGAEPTCLVELARALLETPQAPRQLAPLVEQVSRNADANARLGYMLRGRDYRNDADRIDTLLSRVTEDNAWRVSVSDVETYLQCPFRYFASRSLRIDPDRGPRPVERELGEAAHEILALAARHAMTAERPVQEITDENWLAFLERAIAEHRADASERPRNRRPQREFLHHLLHRRLREVILAHADRWRKGEFSPVGVEVPLQEVKRVALGEGAAAESAVVTPFRVVMPDGDALEIDGRIDRLDRAIIDGRAWIALYDYKAYARSLRRPQLTPPPALQLFLYAAALRKLGLNVAGVLIAPLTASDEGRGAGALAEMDLREQRMAMFRPRGLVDAQTCKVFDTFLAAGTASTVIRANLTKEGKPHRRGDLAPAESIAARCTAAEESVVRAGSGMLSGRIDVTPLSDARRLACGTCDFRPLCRFERGLNPIRAAENALPVVKDAVAEEGGDESDA